MTGRFRYAGNGEVDGVLLEPKRPDSRTSLAPRLAQSVVVAVVTGYGIISILNVERELRGHTYLILICSAVVIALFTVQLTLTTPSARRWSPGRRALALGIQAVLTCIPMAWVDMGWGSMAAPLGGTILLLLPGRFAWPAFSLLPLGMLVWSITRGLELLDVAYFTIATALTGLVIYGLTWLQDLVREVHEARAEMARMAVTQERLRFARDLHDLLGYSLSAISLKCELIQRLVVANPERATAEVISVLGVSRQALADVRLVASGYRSMSLATEAESVAEVMAAADVDAVVDIDCGRLHPLVDTVLATALREGVTNILRHSKAQSCTIRAEIVEETVRLVLDNDGVSESGPSDPADRGSGLGNLDTRLTAIGGRLVAGPAPGGRFRLTAEAPLRPVSPVDQAEAPVPQTKRVAGITPAEAEAAGRPAA
ncbi:sensor histidine kinase [Streptomyces sp. NPDC056773]|uniref:sensor histidine kinase n=1 Tax=unclassified Streptomyces TaxID=2593676 RepID=UPI0036938C8D